MVNIIVVNGAVVDVDELITEELAIKEISRGHDGWEGDSVCVDRRPISRRHLNFAFFCELLKESWEYIL